jgi:hypothetical protein
MPAKVTISVNDNGRTLVHFPGCIEPIIVLNGYPIEIVISGDGPGPDVAIMMEANRL